MVDDMITWLRSKFETIFEDGTGEMTVHPGPKFDYLGMDLDFSIPGTVKISMIPFVKALLMDFAEIDPTEHTATTPASEHLFTVDDNATKLEPERSQKFHTIVAKCLFLTKRARPDIATAISFLTCRVTKADEHDFKKLVRVGRYLRGTIHLSLYLSADGSMIAKWYADGSHAVHNNFRGHSGGGLSLGGGFAYSNSSKQKMNTRSSTETELVAADDQMPMIIWTNNFLTEQGYALKDTVLYQDNQSAILLERNGRRSSSKRTRHLNIRFFFISDRINNKELSVVYCPTEEMIADFFTKPLQGKLFRKFRKLIMNYPDSEEVAMD